MMFRLSPALVIPTKVGVQGEALALFCTMYVTVGILTAVAVVVVPSKLFL